MSKFKMKKIIIFFMIGFCFSVYAKEPLDKMTSSAIVSELKVMSEVMLDLSRSCKIEVKVYSDLAHNDCVKLISKKKALFYTVKLVV